MMVAFRSSEPPDRHWALKDTLSLVLQTLSGLKISKDDLLVTVFGGWHGHNEHFGRDEELFNQWEMAGLGREQIIYVPGSSLFVNFRRLGELAGPRSEIFVRHPEVGFVEIGTIVSESHVISQVRGAEEQFTRAPRMVTGVALGLERLEMLARRSTNVLEFLTDVHHKSFANALWDTRLSGTHSATVSGLVKCIHAGVQISNLVTADLPSPQRTRIQQLINTTRRHQIALGVGEVPVNDLAERCLLPVWHEGLKAYRDMLNRI